MANNKLLEKLTKKEQERNAEFRNPYIDGKDFITFPDFREQLEDTVQLACVTKLRKHALNDNDTYKTDENGEFIWETIYAFIDKRFPDNWSFGGSALRNIYESLVDDDLSEEELNKMLKKAPLEFKLKDTKLKNGKNKGKKMVMWIATDEE